MPNKTVIASGGLINLGGLSLLIGSATAKPVDWTGIAAGGAMTLLGGINLLAHLKGKDPMTVQQDIDGLVARLKSAYSAWTAEAKAVQPDLTELETVVAEIESTLGTAPEAPASSSSTATTTSTATPPASSGDFSKL